MENLRVRLTKQMLQNGLIEMLQSERIEKISITELCQRAQVNRTTFYKYYGNQYDVIEDIIDNLFDNLYEIGRDYPASNLFQREILAYLEKNKSLCVTLIDRVPFDMFSKRLIDMNALNQRAIESFSDEYSEKQKCYLLKYYQNGCFALISSWLHDDNPMPIEELRELSKKISNNKMFK